MGQTNNKLDNEVLPLVFVFKKYSLDSFGLYSYFCKDIEAQLDASNKSCKGDLSKLINNSQKNLYLGTKV